MKTTLSEETGRTIVLIMAAALGGYLIGIAVGILIYWSWLLREISNGF